VQGKITEASREKAENIAWKAIELRRTGRVTAARRYSMLGLRRADVETLAVGSRAGSSHIDEMPRGPVAFTTCLLPTRNAIM